MLLDTLHEDSARDCVGSGGCDEEMDKGDDRETNQIIADGPSCDPVMNEEKRMEGGVGVSLPHGSGSSIITNTFQGMLKNEVGRPPDPLS